MIRGITCLVHDADYRQSQKDWNSFVESLTKKIIEKDETIPELPPKDLVSVPKIVRRWFISPLSYHYHLLSIDFSNISRCSI